MIALLAKRRLLVVEDDFFIAEELVHALQINGAEVIGPAANIDSALDLLDEVEHLDAAVLDLNLQGEMAYPIAEVLLGRAIPFVFATGYDHAAIPPRYQGVACCEKPVDASKIATALFGRA